MSVRSPVNFVHFNHRKAWMPPCWHVKLDDRAYAPWGRTCIHKHSVRPHTRTNLYVFRAHKGMRECICEYQIMINEIAVVGECTHCYFLWFISCGYSTCCIFFQPATVSTHNRALEDELIRQVALNCPERGLLLLRMRDEIRMTIDAYKTLYESRFVSTLPLPTLWFLTHSPYSIVLQCDVRRSQAIASRARHGGSWNSSERTVRKEGQPGQADARPAQQSWRDGEAQHGTATVHTEEAQGRNCLHGVPRRTFH